MQSDQLKPGPADIPYEESAISFAELCGAAITYAKVFGKNLDFSEGSIRDLEEILQYYYEDAQENEETRDKLWNISMIFGVYLGQTLLNCSLAEKGYYWKQDENNAPVLKKDDCNSMSPITKVRKRLENGPEDNVKSFYDIAVLIGSGKFSLPDTALFGFAKADITPLSPMQTIGFGREDERSHGILHSLSAQVSVWQQDLERCCMVTIDHIGFSIPHAEKLRNEIGEMLSVSKEKVMLCFSHTHSAPNDGIEPEYADFADTKIIEAVKEAAAHMTPVKAAWGNAYADLGINRRPECDTMDRRIGILKVVDAANGKLRLVILRLTAHANVLKEDNYLISPDYFGTVRELLAEKYGCEIMLTQGAAGNAAPMYFATERIGTAENPIPAYYGKHQSLSALYDMAEEVYRQVDQVLLSIQPKNIRSLQMYSAFQPLTADVPTYDRAMEIAEEAGKMCGISGAPWLLEVQRLIEHGVEQQTEDVELQYFKINDGCLCGVPNEIMCEFALRASEQLKNEFFYFGGYCNGCTGYFPTEEEYDKGGYEVFWSMLIYYSYYGRVSPYNRSSASVLIDAAVKNKK